MACCPEDSLDQLRTEGYLDKVNHLISFSSLLTNKLNKGEVKKVSDMELYHVGSGSKRIIWNYDIFGFDSGRTR